MFCTLGISLAISIILMFSNLSIYFRKLAQLAGSCINQVSPTKSNNSESELHKMHIQFNSRSSDIQEQHVPVKKRRPAYFLDFNDEKKKLDTLLKNTELPIQSSSHF